MELNTKMSKSLVISLLVLAAVILLAIGAAIGSHSNRYRNFGYNGRFCDGSDNFERGGRRGMMNYRNINQGGQIQGVVETGVDNPAATVVAPVTATTTIK